MQVFMGKDKPKSYKQIPAKVNLVFNPGRKKLKSVSSKVLPSAVTVWFLESEETEMDLHENAPALQDRKSGIYVTQNYIIYRSVPTLRTVCWLN